MKKNLAQLAFNHFYGFRVPNLSSLVVTWDNCSPGAARWHECTFIFGSDSYLLVVSGLRCGAAAVDRSWKTCKARNFEWKSPFSPRHWLSKPPGASAHLTSQPWRDGAGGNSYSINTENWLCFCVCTNMTNLWWPLLNFPRNQDIFFCKFSTFIH